MTLHAAKGLEFPVVFITGMEEGVLPLEPLAQLSEKERDSHIEEERRLCFVGMTSASDVLFLSNASTRFLFGRIRQQNPSRFLSEIPAEILEEPGRLQNKKKRKKMPYKQLPLF